MNKAILSRRSNILNLLILAVLLIALASPRSVAYADTFSASNQAELDAAILAANTNGEADTITITADITLSVSALTNNITSDITINGAGHTLSGAGSFRVLYNSGGDLSINNLTISNGNTSSNGGGIFNAGTLTLNNCTLSGNTASGNGGGVYTQGGPTTFTIINSTFTGNQAGFGGGLLSFSSNSNSINNSTFSGNIATNDGGGLRNNGTLTINDSTFTNNSATINGGGVFNTSTLTLNRNLISGNTAPSPNGSELNNNGGTVTADNYNVFGHDGVADAQAYFSFSPGATNDYNATSDGSNIALASILNTTLADNDGPTWTHALVDNSPAHEFVPNTDAACIAGVSADQRGGVRAGGTATTGDTHCDSGAVEHNSDFTPTAITLSSLNAQSAIPMLSILLVLAIIFAGGFITIKKLNKKTG